MLDVVHFFFEEDALRFESGEQAEAASNFRTKLYELYDVKYKYFVTASGRNSSAGGGGRNYISGDAGFDFDNKVPSSTSQAVKPYIPPTNFDPDTGFAAGGVLDGPLR